MKHPRIRLKEVLRAVDPFPVHSPLYRTEGDERPFEMIEIASRFRSLRRMGPVRLTQEKLGSLIGICRQSVNEIERTHVKPHPSTWARFRDLERRYQEAAHIQPPERWF